MTRSEVIERHCLSIEITRNTFFPLYRQLSMLIATKVFTEELVAGDELPDPDVMAEKLAVKVSVVNMAYSELIEWQVVDMLNGHYVIHNTDKLWNIAFTWASKNIIAPFLEGLKK